jgi:hypothetical protein
MVEPTNLLKMYARANNQCAKHRIPAQTLEQFLWVSVETDLLSLDDVERTIRFVYDSIDAEEILTAWRNKEIV